MSTFVEAALARLTQTALFAGTPPSHLVSRVTFAHHQRGEHIFHVGEPAHSIYVLLDGIVRVSYVNPGGDERIISLFQEGDIFGELFLGKYRHRVGTAQAMSEAIVASITEDDFRALNELHPQVGMKLIAHLADEQRETLARLHALMHLDAHHRLLGTLLGMARKFCCTDDGDWVRFPSTLTQEDIANAACLHRATTNKLINQYRQSGVLGGSRRSLMLNLRAVQSLLEADGLEILI